MNGIIFLNVSVVYRRSLDALVRLVVLIALGKSVRGIWGANESSLENYPNLEVKVSALKTDVTLESHGLALYDQE